MGKSCYKLMLTSLIIIKIRFVQFEKNEVDNLHIKSHGRLYSRLYDNRSYDYGIKIMKTTKSKKKMKFGIILSIQKSRKYIY